MISTALFLLPIVSDLLITGARLAELGTRRNLIAGKIRENLTLRLFLVAGTLVLAASIAEYVLSSRGISWPLFAIGWVMALTSFWLRRKAIAALGRFWSLHVEIRDNHEFVRSGPFRWVRHPAYLSMIMELLALAFICNARFSLLLVVVAFVPVLIMRIRLEEAALIEKFGEAYREYRKTTPALFPLPW
jgi:protein-S-isoprenylcysteine O-methyltransferase Ste14